MNENYEKVKKNVLRITTETAHCTRSW